MTTPRFGGGAAAAQGAALSDDENLMLVGSAPGERLLGEFYRRFPWPWPPMTWEQMEDPDFERRMLNQNLGDWSHRTVPENARIWVAGCGMNQALHTALKFPSASVIGSDVSSSSLEMCRRNAAQLGVTNLDLREETINEAPYREQFDYVICTGVIHHNENPRRTLERLVGAMTPHGVLELMVYNRFHRTLTSCFQKAIRILSDGDLEADLACARRLAEHFPARNHMAEMISQFKEGSESDFADLLIHPLEHSYTVESLEQLTTACGLEYLRPCVTGYGRFCSPSILWEMRFADPALQERYDALSDARRWQVTNLLLHEQSPLLWFYLQRSGSGRPRKDERQTGEEFLARTFVRSATRRRIYVRDEAGTYQMSPTLTPYPSRPPDTFAARILNAMEPGASMGDVFRALRLPVTLASTHEARVRLTTSEFPYLTAVAEA
jgi:2-polyprenyl-3-methyl-5-hydroxy-6-metoxy-1,4-benzoquinol methylase